MRIALLLVAVSGCAHFEHFDRAAVGQWGAEKASRLALCQIQGDEGLIPTRERAVECLGEFARDMGTDACQAADDWIASKTSPAEAPPEAP
jgi:hypothetical protein